MQRNSFLSPTQLNAILELIAGAEVILAKYAQEPLDAMVKDDTSPVTKADIEANHYIVEGLTILTPDIPVIAEESAGRRVNPAAPFWLVDPLDGTKSFIRKRGHYTVNIGLIIGGHAVAGAVGAPLLKALYYTDGTVAYKKTDEGVAPIYCNLVPASKPHVLISHSHSTLDTNAFLETLDNPLTTPMSSSVKLCLIAEGSADIYPRFGPTMEWDTAAGHAILRAAGGEVYNTDGSIFTYAKPGFLNPNFVAYGKR